MASNGSASPPERARAATAAPAPPASPAQSPPSWVGELDLPDVGLVARIVRLNLLVTRVLDDITSAEGIAPADYVVLGVLRRSPGHSSAPTRMCELLDRSTGGMTLTLDRLEAAGWVARAPDPADRRRVVVTLTDAGLTLSERVNDALHAWEDRLGLDGAHRTDAIATVEHLLELLEAEGRR
jgi:DNA-binding MarR family transcriptional regulator